jgi:hypothetical protein
MSPSEHLRYLASIRAQHGKGSKEYGAAVSDYANRLVDPRTGEILGQRAICPACRVSSDVLDLSLRFVLGCLSCGDTGLACVGCGNAAWVRTAPDWYDPTDLSDNRVPVTLKACPICALWVGSGDEGGYQHDGLRAVQRHARYYVTA